MPDAAPLRLVEARCVSCSKRLLDYLNAIREGQLILRKRCRHCHTMNELVIEGRSTESSR
jgi:phage FluMu protein Com